METLILSTFDVQGGAARAAYRLHRGLRAAQINSHMRVLSKTSIDPHIDQISGVLGKLMRGLTWRYDMLPVKAYRTRKLHGVWSINWMPFPLSPFVLQQPIDLLHLHWVGGGYLPLSLIAKLDKPVIWTLHDSWAFTGGCHLPLNCLGYERGCGHCPQLGSTRERDLSRWGVKRKQGAYQHLLLTIVCPSHWLANKARSSVLLRETPVVVIPNGVDTNLFQPTDRAAARRLLNLPVDKRLILSGAVRITKDINKGYSFLQQALRQLAETGWQDRLELVVIGADESGTADTRGIKTHYLGNITDESRMAQLYAAVDAFVLPSMQENLPNMIMESLSCGTPCIAFNIGGIPDLIEHGQNGYLAAPYEVHELARGMAWVLEDEARHTALSARARRKVEAEFALADITQRYIALYADVLKHHRHQRPG